MYFPFDFCFLSIVEQSCVKDLASPVFQVLSIILVEPTLYRDDCIYHIILLDEMFSKLQTNIFSLIWS